MTEVWLGHWDGCCIAYSDICDCDPDNPVNLAHLAEDEFFELQEENYQAGKSDG